MNDALGDTACVDALATANPGSILASCLSPKQMIDYYGIAGVLLAPLAAAPRDDDDPFVRLEDCIECALCVSACPARAGC